jgi:hypothetical protein
LFISENSVIASLEGKSMKFNEYHNIYYIYNIYFLEKFNWKYFSIFFLFLELDVLTGKNMVPFLKLSYILFMLIQLSNIITSKRISSWEEQLKTVNDREQALIDKLLKNYSKKQKPSGSTDVKFALNLNQIVAVKAKDQVFMLNVFLDHEWVDSRLSWGNNLKIFLFNVIFSLY